MARMEKYAKPAALVTHTRSGGSFLATCLSNHPDIFCPRGEPLLRAAEWGEAFPDAGPTDILRCIQRAHFYEIGMCKITYEQFDAEVLGYLQAVQAKVIHLVRRNVIRTVVSQFITGAVVTGVLPEHTEHTDRPVPAVSIPLNPTGLLVHCRRLVLQQQAVGERLRLAGLPLLVLAYEQLIGERTIERRRILPGPAKRICEFLGVPGRRLFAHLRRVNAYPLSTLVANWHEVEPVLRESEFAWCLDEEGIYERR